MDPDKLAPQPARPAGRRSTTGRRLLVAKDMVTSGGQIVPSTADRRGLWAVVNEALCVIDCEQGASAALAAEGSTSLWSLLTAEDLLSAAAG